MEPTAAALATEPAAEPPAAAPRDGLRRKLGWLTLFRVVTVTVLLAGTIVVNLELGPVIERDLLPLYAVVAATYLVALATALALRAGRGLTSLAYAQVVLDVLVATAVVAVTGYSASVFVVIFSIGVVNGAILLFRRGALFAAALAVPAYLTVALRVDPHGADVSRITLLVHAASFVAVAFLSSYLAEQLRSAGERIVAQEGALAEITALHESIVASLTSGLMTLDLAGKVTYLNPAGELLTGLRLEEVRGRPATERFGAFREATPRGEVEWTGPSGRPLRLGYSAFPLRGPAAAAIGSAVIFQDLTALREMENAVQRSRRLADLGRVAAGLAHELRNPLAAMSGSLELLQTNAALPPDERRLMDIVLREAARLDGLVNDLLEYTRPAPLRRVRTDLSVVLDEALRVFANDPTAARVTVEQDLSPVTVACDPDQTRQVFWNLLVNAAQAAAAREGGAGRVRVACGPDVKGARLVVEDDGPGIPAADLPRIFLPFFTTKRNGTGLGLPTVQRVVDAHRGSVTVDSSPGRGTRFVVLLPREGADAGGAGAPG
ncbi:MULTISPECIES: two-component system sensor histidine kinase NtrB [Anaeromyxobacter]|uniref:two-component system sensor histidine kinase NtrB n=1 Tax=Anaeromyxobacter TaxID=161492 RepID=UPI001F58CB8F|nr:MULTISPECIES: ATP-binding protein [unclassified Anaeromyxobacter]